MVTVRFTMKRDSCRTLTSQRYRPIYLDGIDCLLQQCRLVDLVGQEEECSYYLQLGGP